MMTLLLLGYAYPSCESSYIVGELPDFASIALETLQALTTAQNWLSIAQSLMAVQF